MSLNTSINEIVEATLKGVVGARSAYDACSGFSSLKAAPEYFLTSEIAKSIAKHAKGFVTLEEPVKRVLIKSNSNGSSRPRVTTNLNGRHDVVVWYAKDVPHGIIEVKNPVWMFSMIQKDIERVRDAIVMSKRNGGSIKFGAVAFYASSDYPKRKHLDLQERFEGKSGWFKSWKSEAQRIVGYDELKATIHTTKISQMDGWGWAGGVLLIR